MHEDAALDARTYRIARLTYLLLAGGWLAKGRRGREPALFLWGHRLHGFLRPDALCQRADFLRLSSMTKERQSLKIPCSFSVSRRCAREWRTADDYIEINNKKYGLTLNTFNLNTIFRESSDLLHESVGDVRKLEWAFCCWRGFQDIAIFRED